MRRNVALRGHQNRDESLWSGRGKVSRGVMTTRFESVDSSASAEYCEKLRTESNVGGAESKLAVAKGLRMREVSPTRARGDFSVGLSAVALAAASGSIKAVTGDCWRRVHERLGGVQVSTMAEEVTSAFRSINRLGQAERRQPPHSNLPTFFRRSGLANNVDGHAPGVCAKSSPLSASA